MDFNALFGAAAAGFVPASVSENACLLENEDLDEDHGGDNRCRAVIIGKHRLKLITTKHIMDHLGPEALGLAIWPGTHVMARLLMQMEERGELQGRRLLDVGCGTGFLGILARAAGCDSVVLADCEECARQLAAKNVAANDYDSISVQDLSWASQEALDKSIAADKSTFDILLLSEVLYVAQPLTVPWTLDSEELSRLAALTKAKLKPDGVAWVTYGNREDGADQFKEAAEANSLQFEIVPLESVLPAEDMQTQSSTSPLLRVQVFRLTHSDSGAGT